MVPRSPMPTHAAVKPVMLAPALSPIVVPSTAAAKRTSRGAPPSNQRC
jgi:hypothetical protein